MVAEFDPWIVFIDLNMPGMDGYQAAAKLRQSTGATKRRLIALTGYGLPTVEARVHKAGFESYLAKPAMIEDVERLLV